MSKNLQIPEYALDYIFYVEGGRSDDPDDKGGLTNYGISTGLFNLLKKNNVDIVRHLNSVDDLTKEDAKRIYDWIWREYKISERYIYPADLVMFDSYVQHNPIVVGRSAQRALNVLFRTYDIKYNLADDGIIGPKTLKGFQIVFNEIPKGSYVFSLEMIIRRMYVYTAIVLNDPTQKKFLAGWNRRLSILHNTIFTDGRG